MEAVLIFCTGQVLFWAVYLCARCLVRRDIERDRAAMDGYRRNTIPCRHAAESPVGESAQSPAPEPDACSVFRHADNDDPPLPPVPPSRRAT